MKKQLIAMVMAVCMFNFTVKAGITPPVNASVKEVSDKFKDLNKLENYVNQNEGVTLSTINTELLADANIDVAKSSSHEYPLNNKGFNFKDHPLLAIYFCVVIVAAVVWYFAVGVK